jgi:hypothetical protein
VNLVELDFVRSGRPSTLAALSPGAKLTGATPHASVFRAANPTMLELYRFRLRERLPTIRIPLVEGSSDCLLDIHELNQAVSASLGLTADDYAQPLDPPLSPDDAQWAKDRIGSWASGAT